jgi:hypothetical protein
MQQTNTQATQDKPKAVPLSVFTIRTGEKGATLWNKVGVAFLNRDGSHNVLLDAKGDVKPGDKLHIRKAKAPAAQRAA